MKARVRPAWLGVLCAWLLLAVPVHAQPSPDAREAFDRGLAAIEAGRFADAVTLLRDSLELSPRAPTAFNLGVALRGVGDALESRAIFDRLLAGEFGSLPPGSGSQVRWLRAEVGAEVCTITVSLNPVPGRVVSLDGVSMDETEAGTFEAESNPGAHVLRVSAPEHRTEVSRLSLESGEHRRVELQLTPEVDRRDGTLVLDSDDPSATVEIVGVASGAPPLTRSLAPGAYRVRVLLDLLPVHEGTVDVPPGRRVRIVLNPPAATRGRRPWLWAGVVVAVVAAASLLIWGLTQIQTDPVRDPFWGNIPVECGGTERCP